MKPSAGTRFACLLAAAALIATLAPLHGRVARAVTCSDVHVIWARGTGADELDPEGTRFIEDDLKERIGSAVAVSDYRLGVPGFGGHSYPALGGAFEFLVGGFLHLGPYNDCQRSDV